MSYWYYVPSRTETEQRTVPPRSGGGRYYFFFAFFVVFFLALALDAFFFAGMDNLLLVCGTLGSVCLRRDSPRPPINHDPVIAAHSCNSQERSVVLEKIF